MDSRYVRARFREAAEIERHVPHVHRSPAGFVAVASMFDEEPPVYRQLSPDEIARWEECLSWVGKFVHDIGERFALLAWAKSKEKHGAFGAWCRRSCISRKTGERRVSSAVDAIVAGIRQSAITLRDKGDFDVSHFGQEIGYQSDTVATGDGVTWFRAPDAQPAHRSAEEIQDIERAREADWKRRQKALAVADRAAAARRAA